MIYQADKVIGSFDNPFVVSFESGIASANEIAVYPNPVKAGESLNIVVNESATVEIVNALGEVVAVEKLTGNSALRTPATAGVYMLRIITADNNVTLRRVVLQ